MKLYISSLLTIILLSSCMSFPVSTPTPTLPPPTTNTPIPLVPAFKHIVVIVFENKDFEDVIGNSLMPNYNRLAHEYTLLTKYYAVQHPSLPNYLAMIGGDTFGVTENCQDCFFDTPSLPDLIEKSGRTWRTYQEDMPEPCFLGSSSPYAQKHNPFIYFDPIRLDAQRCKKGIVPFTTLQADIEAGTLPNFIFITPNLCNNAHNCTLDVTDSWLNELLNRLVPALEADGGSYLIVLTFDEGDKNGSCCGLPEKAGGRVATVLYSPFVKNGFEDPTPYTHYSLLKTISNAWGLPYLGHAAEDNKVLITAPWK